MSANNIKKRLLLILELLYKKSDEEHPISTVEITEYLNNKGITIDRKTLRSDMSLLIDEMNYDIRCNQSEKEDSVQIYRVQRKQRKSI